jgi:hypothetical protein
MIVSIHVPKTAGMSFRLRLEAAFGPRLLRDYTDWIGLETDEVRAQRAEQTAKLRFRRDELLRDYDIIYGQFVADKYAGVFPTTEFTAFFRDPYQRAVSHYEFLLRHSEIGHPLVRKVREDRPSLPELLKAYPNYQSTFLGMVPLEDFAMVAITEQYERGVALFEAAFGKKLPPEVERGNINPERRGSVYEIGPDVRKAIDSHHAGDVELYHRACERFEYLAARYGI